MTKTLVCSSCDGRHELRFKVLSTWRERLVGLLGTDAGAAPVALVPCSSVHTLFMRYIIDVAFVRKDGRVVASHRGVPPTRLLTAVGAYGVLERPMRRGWWPSKGTVLHIATEEA